MIIFDISQMQEKVMLHRKLLNSSYKQYRINEKWYDGDVTN